MQRRLVDIVQPELALVGLTGARRIAHLCWLNGMRVIPHNWGTAVRTAAVLQFMASLPPLTEALAPPPVLFELDCTENLFRDAVVKRSFHLESDGVISIPQGHGLGIEVVPEAVDSYRSELITIG